MMTRLFTCAILAAVAGGAIADDWSQWRGPNRSGVSNETGLLDEWPEDGPPLLWKAKNAYYHEEDARYMRFLVPEGSAVLDLGCGDGRLLADLKPSRGVGIDFSEEMIALARRRHPDLEFHLGDIEDETRAAMELLGLVLAELGLRVFTMGVIEPLAGSARTRLKALGYADVTTRWGDGYDGWPEHAPFDAIVVTAAASHIPPPLIAQLKPGGRMVIPVGARFMTQQLVLVEKDSEGRVRTRQILPVIFVPFTRRP